MRNHVTSCIREARRDIRNWYLVVRGALTLGSGLQNVRCRGVTRTREARRDIRNWYRLRRSAGIKKAGAEAPADITNVESY